MKGLVLVATYLVTLNMKFTTPEMYKEFLLIDPRVRALTMYVVSYVRPFEIRVTSVLRESDSQSPHTYRRAVDLVIFGWNQGMYDKLVDHLNKHFPYGDGEHKTAIAHDMGSGLHLHLQVIAREDETD